MPKTAKVFVPNASNHHNYEPAKEFGELVIVTEGSISPLKTGNMHRQWELALENSTSEDYILISSLNILCAIGSSLFSIKHGVVNYLIWRSRQGKYEPRSHTFNK